MNFSNIPPKSWFLDCLEIRDSNIHGKGVFTIKSIKEGQIAVKWGGKVVTAEEFRNGVGLKHTNVGIGDDLYLVAESEESRSIDDYMNHSCNPNLWLIDEITLVANRDIDEGEELTIDYAIEISDENYVMNKLCSCNSKYCRQKITGIDWRIKEIQKKYENHFSPFLEKKIKSINNKINEE